MIVKKDSLLAIGSLEIKGEFAKVLIKGGGDRLFRRKVILTLSGCINNNNKTIDNSFKKSNFVFAGESKNWEATYTINFEEDNTFERLLDIKLKSSGTIKGIIEYTLYNNGVKQTYGTGEIGSKIGGKGGGSGHEPLKSDKYLVGIKWDDGEETFPLDLK